MPFKELVQMRKNGALLHERLTTGRALIAQWPHDLYLKEHHGWTLHDALKMERGQTEPNFGRIQDYISEFQSLGLRGPSLLASQLLFKILAFKGCRAALGFCRHFEDNHGFRSEDLVEGDASEGHKLPSLAERFRTFVARESSSAEGGDLVDWAWNRTEAWKEDHPREQWVVYYYAKGLLYRGRREEAAPYIGRAVARNLNQAWAWLLLADLLLAHPTEAFTVRAYALSIQPSAEFWGDAAIQILPQLIDHGRQKEAAWVVRTHEAAYKARGWAIRPAMRDFLDELWSKGEQKPLESKEFRAQAQTILAFACAYEVVVATIDHQNCERGLAWAMAGNEGFPLSHRLPAVRELKPRDRVRVFKCENRPVFVQRV